MDKIKFSQFEFEEVSNKGKYKSAVESLLFVCGEPISLKEISRILDISEDQTEIVIELLKEDYNNRDRGIKLISLNPVVLPAALIFILVLNCGVAGGILVEKNRKYK